MLEKGNQGTWKKTVGRAWAYKPVTKTTLTSLMQMSREYLVIDLSGWGLALGRDMRCSGISEVLGKC